MDPLFELDPYDRAEEDDRDYFVPAQAHARNTDPGTSHAAARSIPSDKIRKSQKAVLALLRARGPMTDAEIAEAYSQMYRLPDAFPPQSPSGLRTRRSELHHAGLIEDTGLRRKLRSGRMAIVWGLAA